MAGQSPARAEASAAALELIERLRREHGPLMFHQSGGCCDGSAPMCFPVGEFKLGARDVLLGELGGSPFYIGGHQAPLWEHTQLVLDVVPGRGAGFSLEAPLGVRFIIRSRVFTPEERAALGLSGETPEGVVACEVPTRLR